ncbi:HAMP domain-containing sensor histidine kinase [Christiangramia sp. OXR-203]|uniref:sensor histidine kinase n=1 Tax=Christiangramia sp. OXR-203 TaxID=3100176 RepID=UPI002AC9A386|nr:HAMP domain-containing sensor histidine kinase [Christiangramia sp. OXR-203]WPY99865.1 HAMP domain-containing sensor histidine kinase [Christiangramia sp. OXR-203]
MTFKSCHTGIFLRILILVGLLSTGLFCFFKLWYIAGIFSLLLTIISVYELFRFLSKRFEVIDDFFESVKYRDFSRQYLAENKTKDIRLFYEGFNTVNEVVRKINSEKETQYLYLQKILELVDIGIMAYETESGKVLWSNGSFQNTLEFPSFKNISFVSSRNPEVYQLIFDKFYPKPTAIEISVQKETIKVLLSNSIFQIGDKCFKLVVLHNIEDTLNKTESEAWKKLLSVMTHEIMNSIAPISSLANTLKFQVQIHQENPKTNKLDIEDLDAGLSSIEKRSEGLLKFAKTYRSLNKVTSLNLEKVLIKDVFDDLEHLMRAQLKNKHVALEFRLADEALEIEIDTYLMEQVIINLILNAVEACERTEKPEVIVMAVKKPNGKILIAVIDNGSGIPLEIQDQMFVPFFTTKEKGSGIGLSLSRQIMTLHGGKIQIDNLHEKGAKVSLVF